MENESVDGICKQATPEKPIYNVSNHIFYNYGSVPGGVLVQNDKEQNTTIASGYRGYIDVTILNVRTAPVIKNER